MTAFKKWLSHNQALATAIVVAALLLIVGFGCNVTTHNPFNPTEKVTRGQLDIEVERYTAAVELAYEDLSKKEAILKAITEAALAYTTTGGVSVTGLLSLATTVLGAGAVIDNRRKDAVIKSKSGALALIGNLMEEAVTETDTTPGHQEA